MLLACTCAPIRWEGVVGLPCDSTPFLWCLPKETVSSRQRKAPFLPRRLHHPRERYKSVVGTFLARLGEGVGGCLSPYLRRGRTGLVMAALRGRSTERASLYFYASAYHQSAFLWGSTPFLCARAKKWGGTGRASAVYCQIKRRTRKRRKKDAPRWGVFLITGSRFPGSARRGR